MKCPYCFSLRDEIRRLKEKNEQLKEWQEEDDDDGYMDIHSTQGTKVVFTACGGMDGDKRYAKKKLVIGEIYIVRRTEIHSCHTNVYLEDFPEDSFNSCLFEKWEEKPKDSEWKEPRCSKCGCTSVMTSSAGSTCYMCGHPRDKPTIKGVYMDDEYLKSIKKPKDSEFEDDPIDFQEAFEQCSRENTEAYKEIERLKPFEVWNKKAIKILNGLGKSYMILDVIRLVETLEGKR